MKQSKLKDYISSSSSEDEYQISPMEIVKQRKNNSFCRHRFEFITEEQNDKSIQKIRHLTKYKYLVRATECNALRKEMRRDSRIIESIPKWFTLREYILNMNDVNSIYSELNEIYGCEFDQKMNEYTSRHPIPLIKKASPMLQNVKITDFFYIVMFYALKDNDVDVQTLRSCASHITYSFYKVLQFIEGF